MELSSQQLALKAKAAALSNGLIRKRAAQIDQSGEYPWDVVEALKAEHFMGMTIPKEYGGQGRSLLDTVLVVEEIARSCTVSARIVVEANMGAISTVMAYGTDAQRKRAADLVLAGDKPAICITEPDAGSDASGMKTRADKRGNRYVLNGRKHWITGAGVSRLHLIFARVFDEGGEELGVGGFLAVRGEAEGLRVSKRETTMGLCGMPEGELVFEDLEITPDKVLLPPRASSAASSTSSMPTIASASARARSPWESLRARWSSPLSGRGRASSSVGLSANSKVCSGCSLTCRRSSRHLA